MVRPQHIERSAATTRRTFLQWLVAAAASAPFAAHSSVDRITFKTNPFALGVASGSPAHDGFVIWTRLVGDAVTMHPTVPVRWEVWDAQRPGYPIRQGVANAQAVLGHSVHVALQGLEANRWYGYRFMVNDAVSMTGRSRTLPTAQTAIKRWRLAYASCQRWEHSHYAAYRQMLADEPDLVVFLGDYIYEYAGRHNPGFARAHGLPRIASLQDYRDRYALYRSDPDLQRMHAACPWAVTWDDHEVENNYAATLSTMGHPDLTSLRMAAYQAFYEHMPIRPQALVDGWPGLLAGKGIALHTTIDIGSLARIYMLDNRQYRDAPQCVDQASVHLLNVCTATADPDRSILGFGQEHWLSHSLRDAARSKIAWNVLAQQTRFTPSNYLSGEGKQFSPDGWDGYPDSRRRLIGDLVSSQANNPVILGGDIHQHWVAHVHQNPYDVHSPVVASEFVGTSLASQGPHPLRAQRLASQNPHCLFADSRHRGYGLADLTPNSLDITLKAVSNPKDPDASTGTLARFQVVAGDPTIHRKPVDI